MDDILTIEESKKIVDICLQRGANLNRLLSTDKSVAGFDAHQINCTYYAALDCDDDAYLAARAIQFFAPGVPQVYYVGLLAGENDYEGVERTGEGRAINRTNYSIAEVEIALQKPVVRRLLNLIRFRNDHSAFGGVLEVPKAAEGELRLVWRNRSQRCSLLVDLKNMDSTIEFTSPSGELNSFQV